MYRRNIIKRKYKQSRKVVENKEKKVWLQTLEL